MKSFIENLDVCYTDRGFSSQRAARVNRRAVLAGADSVTHLDDQRAVGRQGHAPLLSFT